MSTCRWRYRNPMAREDVINVMLGRMIDQVFVNIMCEDQPEDMTAFPYAFSFIGIRNGAMAFDDMGHPHFVGWIQPV